MPTPGACPDRQCISKVGMGMGEHFSGWSSYACIILTIVVFPKLGQTGGCWVVEWC